MKRLKVGIVGCGGIAFQKHLPSIRNTQKADIVAFCDPNRKRAEEAAREFGPGNVYVDYHEMLQKEELDVVNVCTPNCAHAAISIAALEAGCHVLCEKPMATTYADAKKMYETAIRTGRKLSVGYQNRYREDSQYLKKMCECGDLGDIYYARAFSTNRRYIPSWGVFEKKELQGGGALIDIGTHSLDLTLWLMDNYKPLYVSGQTYKKLSKTANPESNATGPWNPNIDVEESAFGFIMMENGAVINLQAAWALNMIEKLGDNTVLCGTKAGADMFNSANSAMGHMDGLRINQDLHGKLVTIHPNFYPSATEIFFDAKDYNRQIITGTREEEAFYAAILEDKELVVKPEQALCVSMILEGIYRSAELNRPVYFSEFQ